MSINLKDILRDVFQELSVPPPSRGLWARTFLTLKDGVVRDEAGLAAKAIFCEGYSIFQITADARALDSVPVMLPERIVPRSFLNVNLEGPVTHRSSKEDKPPSLQTSKLLSMEMEDGSYVMVMGPRQLNGLWGIRAAKMPRELLSTEVINSKLGRSQPSLQL